MLVNRYPIYMSLYNGSLSVTCRDTYIYIYNHIYIYAQHRHEMHVKVCMDACTDSSQEPRFRSLTVQSILDEMHAWVPASVGFRCLWSPKFWGRMCV